MKVLLAKHGGQAAAINLRLPPKIVDSASMSKAESEELARLVDAVNRAPVPKDQKPEIAGDLMGYTITVENDGPPIVLRQSDLAMSPAFAALLNWLERYSSEK